MRDLAPIAATLLLTASVGCDPDIGEPVETVIVQDAGADSDAAPVAPGAAGARCTKNAECMSNRCFAGNTSSYCSFACTAANAMTTCATPPFNGKCNQQGFCRLP